MSDFIFDLQLFDEGTTETSTAEENSAVESSEQKLPEGFEGLEEYKDEILAEISEVEKPQEETETATSDYVPYQRFKQVIDEKNALKAQIDEMKKQSPTPAPEVNQPPQIPKQQVQTPLIPEQQIQMPQIQVTPEFMKAFKTATNNLAMQMTKFTPEQVEQIEDYGEDGEADVERWNFAKQQAAQYINYEIEKVKARQAQQAQSFLNNHNAAVKYFNDFASKEMQAPEYQEVVNYATGELFDSLPPVMQQAIANSYVKLERQTASPSEVMLVVNFYQQAKAALGAKKAQSQTQTKKTEPKVNNLPKVDSLNGANVSNSDGLSAKDLERIIDSTEDFDSLDPKIKKLFEG